MRFPIWRKLRSSRLGSFSWGGVSLARSPHDAVPCVLEWEALEAVGTKGGGGRWRVAQRWNYDMLKERKCQYGTASHVSRGLGGGFAVAPPLFGPEIPTLGTLEWQLISSLESGVRTCMQR
ncbi:hypothetical protein EDB83DRAFT_2446014 [Lactarius deliciosus]|nr:hypothetical protein EDB83DRAFT_2446014 [Lactarius deliciosus]